MSSQISFLRREEDAVLPSRSTPQAAGFDLVASESTVIPPGGRALISTGLSIVLPPGVYGRIAPRSGLAWKNGIHVGAGVIDRDYEGVIKVLLHNLDSFTEFKVEIGMRIAQLIPEKYLEEVEVVEIQTLSDSSQRGEGGFGSTGV